MHIHFRILHRKQGLALVLAFLLFLLSGCQDNIVQLVDLNVIFEDEVNKDAFITNFEILDVIRRITQSDTNAYIKDWYYGGELEPLDYLHDDSKLLMLGLHRCYVMTLNDMFTVKLDENATFIEALTYITRMVGDTFSCVDYPKEFDFVEKTEVYQAAYKKGLISSENKKNADSPIPRKEFYKIIGKAINVEFTVGGDAISKRKYVDELKARIDQTDKSESTIQEIKISAEYTVRDDISISWTLPSEYSFLYIDNFFVNISLIMDDKTEKSILASFFGSYSNGVGAEPVINSLIRAYPQKPEYLRVTCTKFNEDGTKNEKYFFDIGISNIYVVVEGEEAQPGIFTTFAREWVPETITLANGGLFKADTYYLITSYENSYRKPEYNSVSTAIFRVDEDTDIVNNEDKRLNLNCGGLYLNEMHLQEIHVVPAGDGFKLSVTPESEMIFIVEECSKQNY